VYARQLALAQSDVGFKEAAALELQGLDAIRGRLAAAAEHGRQARAAAELRGLPGNYVSYAVFEGFVDLRYRNDPTAALAIVDAALNRHPLAIMSAYDRPYGLLAAFYAEAGQPARAKALLADYERNIPEPVRRGNPGGYGAAGYVALAEGRPQDAIAGFRAWYDGSGCAACGLFELGRAYERANQPDSALAVYERAVTANGLTWMHDQSVSLGFIYRRLGELYELRGDAARAREYYGRFVDLWKNADPELQPLVRDVRARIIRLTGEPTN
jgi:eukaryotic-like serine/threonine-protein kinase